MPAYPESHRGDVVDHLHGHEIADPYRLLEDPDSAETTDWVRRQNEVTETELSSYPERPWFQQAMTAILARPRAGVPEQKSGWFFVGRNDGTQAQDVVYVADSVQGLLDGGRVIIDPNQLSEDGTDSLGSFTVSPDGRYFAYGINESGSDWTTFKLLEVATGTEVDDVVTEAKFCEATWLPGSSAYLYLHYPSSGRSEGTETKAQSGGQLKVHRVGTPQADDQPILSFPQNDRLFITPEVSDDDRYVVVHISQGTDPNSRLWLYPIEGDGGLGEPIKLIDEFTDETIFVRMAGDRLVLRTDRDAPRGGWSAATSTAPSPTWFPKVKAPCRRCREPRPDSPPCRWSTRTRCSRCTISTAATPVSCRSPVAGWSASPRARSTTRASSASPRPPNRPSRTSCPRRPGMPVLCRSWSRPARVVSPRPITLTRRVAPGRDASGRVAPGQDVPYFVISRADLDVEQPRPTLMYGYGGFKISILPDYKPGWPAWLAAGGVLVITNLRGGGEYGSAWHDDGRLKNKQNVFDDFIAVAENLQDTKVTTPQQLAIHGRSNGGLLVGAVMAQRPDLFAVAVPGVGVMDMLRFHLFTVGAAWASDFGLPDDPSQFEDLLAYSPLHNLHDGTAYPATLVVTGDHDDRVVPLHSHKFIGTLQHAQAGESPVLTRIEVNTGHGFGKPAAMVASEWADLLAFAAHHTGLQPDV